MDNLFTFFIVIIVIISIFKNIFKNVTKNQNIEVDSTDYDYEEDEYDEEEVPDSIKQLWDRFKTTDEVKGAAPPPIPDKKEEFVQYECKEIRHEQIRHKKMDEKPIVHKRISHNKTSEDFIVPEHKMAPVIEKDYYAIEKKKKKNKFKVSRKELKKAVILKEILSKPVSLRD